MSPGQSVSRVELHAPERILLCLGPCLGEFYYPLAEGESATCPVDGTHPVKVYRVEVVLEHEEDDLFDVIDNRPVIGYCSKCGEAREDDYTCRDGGRTIPSCPECGGRVKDAEDGPYRACVKCGHITDSDPGFS